MHHQVDLDRVLLRSRPRVDEQAVALPLDGRDGRIEPDFDAKFPGRLHQLGDQVRVELVQRVSAPVEHLDSSPCTRRDVRELQGDVATADEGDAGWQVIQFQELRAGSQQFLARYAQWSVTRAGRDHYMAANEGVPAHLDARPIHEVGTAMTREDPRLREALLSP